MAIKKMNAENYTVFSVSIVISTNFWKKTNSCYQREGITNGLSQLKLF